MHSYRLKVSIMFSKLLYLSFKTVFNFFGRNFLPYKLSYFLSDVQRDGIVDPEAGSHVDRERRPEGDDPRHNSRHERPLAEDGRLLHPSAPHSRRSEEASETSS